MLRTLDASPLAGVPAAGAAFGAALRLLRRRVAVAVAVIGAVFGELVGSDQGLGHVIQVGTAQLLTARVFAATLLLAVMGIALFALVGSVQRRAVPWAGRERRLSARRDAPSPPRSWPCLLGLVAAGCGEKDESVTGRSSSASSTWRSTGSRTPTTSRSTRRRTAATTSRWAWT